MKIERIFSSKEKIAIAIVSLLVVIITIVSILSVRQGKENSVIRSDANTALSAMQQFAGSHEGNYPNQTNTTTNAFINDYKLSPNYNYSFGDGNAEVGQIILSNKNCSGNPGASVHFYESESGSGCID